MSASDSLDCQLYWLPNLPRLFSSREIRIEVVQILSSGKGQSCDEEFNSLCFWCGSLTIAESLLIDCIETLDAEVQVRRSPHHLMSNSESHLFMLGPRKALPWMSFSQLLFLPPSFSLLGLCFFYPLFNAFISFGLLRPDVFGMERLLKNTAA